MFRGYIAPELQQVQSHTFTPDIATMSYDEHDSARDEISEQIRREAIEESTAEQANKKFSRTQALIDRPQESLFVELKRWIDPDLPEGEAKIAKASFALRNFGGGYLVIGFDNQTLEPDKENVPDDVKTTFHIDKIQGIVSRFASEVFEILVEYPEREAQPYPVIIVPSGVKTPVAAKKNLAVSGNNLIQMNDVYIRSLHSSGTISSTKATWNDWSKIVEICFDNREADIGRFLRRHLGGLTPDMFNEFASVIAKGNEQKVTTEEILQRCLQESKVRYEQKVVERHETLPEHGSWEVALCIVGDIPKYTANKPFLNLLRASNPSYSGWPVWLDSQDFSEVNDRPSPHNGVWEAFINSTLGNHIEFMRLDPKGQFYHYRALLDDVSKINSAPKPFTELDISLAVADTAEAIAVGIAFARSMLCNWKKTSLSFAFRWSRLKGRNLGQWALRGRYYTHHNCTASQDEFTAYVDVPLDTPLSALSEYVNQVTKPLFEVFDGFVLNKDVVDDLVQQLIERKLF